MVVVVVAVVCVGGQYLLQEVGVVRQWRWRGFVGASTLQELEHLGPGRGD